MCTLSAIHLHDGHAFSSPLCFLYLLHISSLEVSQRSRTRGVVCSVFVPPEEYDRSFGLGSSIICCDIQAHSSWPGVSHFKPTSVVDRESVCVAYS